MTIVSGTGNAAVGNLIFGNGQFFNGIVASFIGNTPGLVQGPFTAVIDWGNGNTSQGTITADSFNGGQFDVSGTNAYAVPGSYVVTVTITDALGNSIVISSSITVF